MPSASTEPERHDMGEMATPIDPVRDSRVSLPLSLRTVFADRNRPGISVSTDPVVPAHRA